MSHSNESYFQSLTHQINGLLNEEFIQELKLGKYSKWAVNLTSSEIIPILSALGQYGKLSPQCPDIDTRPMFAGYGLNETSDLKLFLNQDQLNILDFLIENFNFKLNKSKTYTIPFEYSWESPHFSEAIAWAMGLTKSDLFGVLCHVGGFSVRSFYKTELKPCINDYQPRIQECLICLMRVTQGQATYYQVGGKRYPLREYPTNQQ